MTSRGLVTLACCLYLVAPAFAVWAHAGVLAEDGDPADAPLSIAVARFSHGESDGDPALAGLDVAELLAKQLTERRPTRVVEPAAFGLPLTSTSLEARVVRDWAERAGVDTVVVGWTTALNSAARGEAGIAVKVEVRSGHTGVAIASYQAPFVAMEDPEAALDVLAASILTGLGYTPPGPPPASPKKTSDKNAVSKLLGKGQSIAIESDELEVTQVDGERHIIFSRSVRVELDDIRLQTDRLDAFYKKGESQPDRLVATGAVTVQRGDRKARCDFATFYHTERQVICRGRAAMQQGCNLVRGEEILFDLGEDRVVVTGGASVVIQSGDGDCKGERL